MNEMAPKELIMDDFGYNNFQPVNDEHLLIVIGDKKKQKHEKDRDKQKIKVKKVFKEMWENEQFIQIKGIQKTQEAVNKSVRKLQLDKLRMSRNKRVEEASENIRKRREALQQKQVLKEVLQNMKSSENQLHDERNLNEINTGKSNKETGLIINCNTQSKRLNENLKNNKRFIHNDENNKDILPPLVRATRKRPHFPMASVKNKAVSTSTFEDSRSSNYVSGSITNEMNSVAHKRSIVITIPDVNTDASFIQRSSTRISKSANSSKPSGKSEPDYTCNIQTSKDEDHPSKETKSDRLSSARTRFTDLPPIKFTLQGLKGPPVSYCMEKDNMVSYRPAYGFPVSRSPEEKAASPTMMVSPRNTAISIPQVRMDFGKSRDNLSVVGKNLKLPSSQDLDDYSSPNKGLGRVSSYDIRSSISPDSSCSSSTTPPRHSLKGSKLIRKKVKEPPVTKDPKYTTATGFVISEFSMQERIPRKPNVQIEKQPVHDFPVHVRERFIKKKLLMAQTDKRDVISWKVRKYVTDPGSFSSAMSRDMSSPIEFNQDQTYRRLSDDYISSGPPNRKDISDLLLRMLLKQHPRNQIQKERTVPSEDKILSSLGQRTMLPNNKTESGINDQKAKVKREDT